MTYIKYISLCEIDVKMLIEFDYYREDNEDVIILNSIEITNCKECNETNFLDIIHDDDLEEIKKECAEHYKYENFKYWEKIVFGEL